MTIPCEQKEAIRQLQDGQIEAKAYQAQGLEFRQRVEKQLALILILVGALLAGVNGKELLGLVVKAAGIPAAVASEAGK